jgi:translation initiation factor 2B subunit (eIF-2B alpha/beta/delta family)
VQSNIQCWIVSIDCDPTSRGQQFLPQWRLTLWTSLSRRRRLRRRVNFPPIWKRCLAESYRPSLPLAVMLDLAQRVLVHFRDDLSFPMMKQRVQEALVEFRHEQRRSMEALCEQALGIFPSHATVLTYSNSATVTAALCHAHAHGHLDRVLLSEARPAFDGRPLARKLAEAGVTVEYGIDMGLFAGLAEADLVVFGADAVFPTHFLNKIGTHALAELAQARGVPPCFSLCASNKFLPAAATGLLRILSHRTDEIWPEAVRGVRVHNRYFEEIPLSLLRGVVSDQGVHTPETVRLMLQQRSLPAALQRLNTESTPE